MVMPISRRRVAKNRVLRSLTDISSPLSVGYVKHAIGRTTAAQWPTTGHRQFLGRNRRHLTTAEVPLDPEHLAELFRRSLKLPRLGTLENVTLPLCSNVTRTRRHLVCRRRRLQPQGI